MNSATSLAVFATLCRETGRPFRFPGAIEQYHFLTDITDSRSSPGISRGKSPNPPRVTGPSTW